MTTEKRRTRGISEASATVFHGASSRWAGSASGSDSSESGTTPSSPRSLPEGDEVPLYSATNAVDFVDAEMLSGLSARLPSPLAPASGLERQYADFFSPHMFGDSMVEASSPASILYNPPSPSTAYLSETPPLLGGLGDSTHIDPFSLWSPSISAGPATPIDAPFLDLALGMSQQTTSSLYHSQPVTPGGTASELQSPTGDGMLSSADYLSLYPSSNAPRESPYLTQSIPELSSLALDAQVTIGSLPAFPDKASVQLAQQAGDPSDRRVAVAVAICDQQDVISTVHSLSHSLSSMLGQGQVPGAEDTPTPKTYPSPHSPQPQPCLWQS